MTAIRRNQLLIVLGLLVGVGVLGAFAYSLLRPQMHTTGASGVGGPFALTSQDGKIVTDAALRGHPTLVFFGYTHCPDVCPATLADMSAVFKALGPASKVDALFVTVDPQRDTPVVLKDYLTSFDPRIIGLTGSPEAINQIKREYKVYAKAVPDKDGTYTMDHTAITYLMDKDGQFVGAFSFDRPPAQSAAELKQYD